MEKMLITKIKRTDETRADLYGKGHKWPDLKLFDIGELLAVGITPEDLPIGVEKPCRFLAHYTLSDKINEAGNPYKDVSHLEPIDNGGNGTTAPAPMNDAMLAAILKELQTQTKLLQALAGTVAGPVEEEIDETYCPECKHPQEYCQCGQYDNPPEEEPDLADYIASKPSEPPIEHEATPTSSTEMVGYLGRLFPTVSCQGVGHLLYVMKKIHGEGWGWPNSEDTTEWEQVVTDWGEYWQALT